MKVRRSVTSASCPPISSCNCAAPRDPLPAPRAPPNNSLLCSSSDGRSGRSASSSFSARKLSREVSAGREVDASLMGTRCLGGGGGDVESGVGEGGVGVSSGRRGIRLDGIVIDGIVGAGVDELEGIGFR